jgi:predicted Zn-dependent peptidase
VIKTIASELRRIKKHKVTQGDIDLFKTQVSGALLLGSDDIENRMQSIGINEMVFKKYKPVDEILEEVNAVTRRSVNEYLDKTFDLEQMGAILMGGGAYELKDWFMDFKF